MNGINISKRGGFFLLFILFLLALGLRLWGYDWGLPYRLHPDEWKYVFNAVEMCGGHFDTGYYQNPTGFTILLASLYSLFSLFQPFPNTLTWYEHQPHDFYAIARIVCAFLGALTIIVQYRLSRFFLSRVYSIFSAMLLAVAFLHVRDSHFAVNDIFMTFVVMLSLLMSLYYVRNNQLKFLVLAGFCAGLAMGIKYNAFPILFSILYVIIIAKHDTYNKVRSLGYMILAIVVGFLLCMPAVIFAPGSVWSELLKLIEISQQPRGYSEDVDVVKGILITCIIGLGVVPSVLAAIGLYRSLRQNVKINATLLLFFVSYLAVVMTGQLYFSRFLLPIFPVLILFGFISLQGIDMQWSNKVGLFFFSTLLLIMLVESLFYSVRLGVILQEKDTRVLALEYGLQHLPEEAIVLSDPFALPFLHHGSLQLPPEEIVIVDYNKISPQQFFALQQEAKLLLVSDFTGELVGKKETSQEWKSILQSRRLITVVRPFVENNYVITEDEVSVPFQHIWVAERSGPTITIYQ